MAIIIRPITSEKSLREANKKRYTFEVDIKANKTQIKKAAEKTFKVNVIKVQTITIKGKAYRMGKKWQFGHKSDWKKAVIEVKPDQKIDLFEHGN